MADDKGGCSSPLSPPPSYAPVVCAGLSISCVSMVCVCVCVYMHTHVHTNFCETSFVHGDGTLNSLQSLAICIETVN